MKPQAPLTTMTTNTASPSRCIALIQMATGHQRIRRRILGHLHKKETREVSIKDPPSIAREVAHRITVMVVAEALIYSDLRAACIMVATQTIARKTTPFFSSLKERWSKTPSSLRNNQHQVRSTTPCNGLPPPTNNNIVHPTFAFFHSKSTQTAKPKLWHITTHIIMLQPTTSNLRQPSK
jgi:hypothetical protein